MDDAAPLSVVVSTAGDAVRVTKTGPQTAEVVVSDAGSGPQTFEVGDLWTAPDGSIIGTITSVPFLRPSVRFMMTATNVQIAVTGALFYNRNQTLVLTAAQIEQVKGFFAAAAYPALRPKAPMPAMSSDQFASVCRAFLGAVGGLLIAYGLMSDASWQTDSGAILSVASLVWSAYHHGLNSDLILGAVRNCTAMVCGILIARGVVNGNEATAIQGAILTFATMAWAHDSKKPSG